MSSDDSSQVESENGSRERTKNPEQWKVNKIKFERQRGESYISTSEKVVKKKKELDLHALAKYYKKNCTGVNNGMKKNVTISKYMQFEYDASQPGYVKCYDYIDGAISYSFKLLKQNQNPELPSNKAYSEPVSINKKKINDIKQNIYSANILFVSVTPSINHQKLYQSIWKELSLRGHNVHVVTSEPLKDPSLTNLTEYDISSHYDLVEYASVEKKKYALKAYYRISEDTFRHKEVQNLLKKDIKFDVAVIEIIFPTMLGFGAKYKCPIVGINYLGSPLVTLDIVGNPSHPVTFPDQNLPVTRDMNFRERLLSALYSAYIRFRHHVIILPHEDAIIRKYLGEDIPYLGDIEQSVSVLLLNRNPVFHRIAPVVPALVDLGIVNFNRTRAEIDSNDCSMNIRKPDCVTIFGKDIIATKELSRLSEETFRHKEVQKLLKKDIKFDVAVIEWLFPTMAGFAAKYKCSLVGITSLGAPLVALDTVGNPSHPVTSPDHNLPVTRDMTFRERLISALYSVYVRFWYHVVVLPREDILIKKYLGKNLPYIGDIERNISILLLNRNPVFHRSMPLVPAIIELGTVNVNKTRQNLNSELRAFLDKSKQGVVYFNLGSNMKGIYLPNDTVEIFLSVFKQLPYNVIFKWENDTLPGKPDNVYISKWLPQLTILGE
ncbi:hypothetical protein NQ314_003244 [Rhamnusium bicolor]|uniref:Glycosyltransferase n=1 Tax=Rhamnusium bicolor TaxID=1586634 RepID=A0AAV8ZMN1_9CUCU|nr:hypothetical protein NQ314_003244 [Rhamnusium bicolor]